MPQEVEVWYLIPALRRELTKIFVKEHNFSQKETAKILGITEAAVSQYLKSKRGSEIKFPKKDVLMIKKIAGNIAKNPKSSMKELYDLCTHFRGSKTLCEMHKKMDKTVPKKCNACV